MTSKEKQILEIIKANPTIEQSEIGKLLNIKRSTVAVHISSLQKQGYLMGKGYIVKKQDYIVGIGASNVDVYGKSRIKIRTHYDHPADISSNVGGVMHNIITNYVKLGNYAKLITAYSDDAYGDLIVKDCNKNNIDISDSLLVKDKTSGIFMQIQDENNDMYLAICDMSVLEQVTPSYLRSKENVITNAKLVVMDPSLTDEAIVELIKICKNRVPICLDPISDNYAIKMRKYVKDLYCVKPNKSELQALANIPINSDDDLIKACNLLIKKGLKRIFVSLGKDGVLYVDKDTCIRRKLKAEKKMVNASGAGDAFMAAILHGLVNELDINDTINYGLAAGIGAIRSIDTINRDMSIDLLKKILKENK